MRTAQQQSVQIQEMSTSLREGIRLAQERLKEAEFIVTRDNASRLKVGSWFVAGVVGVASLAAIAAAPVVAVVGAAVAASIGTAGVMLESTAKKREAIQSDARAFLKEAQLITKELHAAYNEVRREIMQNQSASSDYSPSADMIQYQADRARMAQEQQQRAEQQQNQSLDRGLSVRKDQGPRLG
jgi:hypothetical protein